MLISHPEIPITTIKDGKKFVTYIDAYTENLEDVLCPCCGKPLQFFEEKEQLKQGASAIIFHLVCSDCTLDFHGLNDYHVFSTYLDFIDFVRSRLFIKETRK